MLELNKIYNVDCIDGMKSLDDNSVDLVITSPPYDNIRNYKGYELDLHQVGVQISRILKYGGMCVMVIQDQTKDFKKSLTSFRTIVDWIDSTELNLWECCIYQRNGTPGAWWNKRFRVDHEYIPIFMKGNKPQYFNKEHMMVDAVQAGVIKKIRSRKTDGGLTNTKSVEYKDKKCPGTIMDYKSEKNKRNELKNIHPATFPDKLAEDYILAFSTETMVVVDPFIGSGTVARMAKKNNRNYIGFEISQEYCDLANRLLEF